MGGTGTRTRGAKYCIKCIYCLIEEMSKSFLFSVTDMLNDSRLSHHHRVASAREERVLTNGRRVFIVLTNEKREFGDLSNQRRVWRVLTNEEEC